MRRIDELHLKDSSLGARRLAHMLHREGIEVGRRHVGILMQLMGIEAIYRKRRTRLPDKGHKIHPYPLGTVGIDRHNQIWAADITYLPMTKEFAYPVAILDLYSRKVLIFQVSNAAGTDFCVEAMQEALTRCGAPRIFNTDQGSQFTAEDFTQRLEAKGVRVSMDGEGRWVDNVFVERLAALAASPGWRSVKYEDRYLHGYETVREVKVALASYFSFYNARRMHQTLHFRTPDEVYFGTDEMKNAA